MEGGEAGAQMRKGEEEGKNRKEVKQRLEEQDKASVPVRRE